MRVFRTIYRGIFPGDVPAETFQQLTKWQCTNCVVHGQPATSRAALHINCCPMSLKSKKLFRLQVKVLDSVWVQVLDKQCNTKAATCL